MRLTSNEKATTKVAFSSPRRGRPLARASNFQFKESLVVLQGSVLLQKRQLLFKLFGVETRI